MERPSVRLNTKIETENAMVVACFPSIGMVSSVVAHFLIDHLDCRSSHSFRKASRCQSSAHTLESRSAQLKDATK
jgi:predicted ATP-grasp superfamily ATP-dependent carboligase